MNVKKITIAILGATLLAGCASLEERLASADPEVKKDAERDLLIQQSYEFDANKRLAAVKRVTNEDVLASFAMSIPDPKSEKYQDRRPEALAALEKVTDEKLLASVAVGATSEKIKAVAFDKIKTDSVRVAVKDTRAKQAAAVREKMYKIIENARDENVILGAFGQIDFSQPGAAMEFITTKLYYKVMGRADERSEKGLFVARRVAAGLSDEEMCAIITNKHEVVAKIAFPVGCVGFAIDERYVKEGKCADVIAKKVVEGDFFTAKGTTAEKEKLKEAYKQRLMGMLNEITDEDLVMRVLPKIDDANGREILFSKLSETNIVAIASNYGEKLDVCVDAARYVKNQNDLLKVMRVILHMLANEEQLERCDEKKIKATVARLPELSAEILAKLMSDKKCHWKYLVDLVSSSMAYQLITEGKIGCSGAEEAIAQKIDKQSIDAKIYSKAKSLVTKKLLLARMSDAQKKAVRELDAKAYALVREKAKVAAKDTFELDGFYLGMTYDDMKVVFAHHFPDFEIVEGKDNDGDSTFRVSYQTRPFCYVNAKTGKVYQFNFGKKILRKWYKYDTQTYGEWAGIYGREHKSRMIYKMLEKNTDVYISQLQTSGHVWLHQETYTHKSNAKGYVLTYFGEPELKSLQGGLEGEILQQAAKSHFWYLSADAGTLRVEYSAD